MLLDVETCGVMDWMAGEEEKQVQPPFWQTYRVPIILGGVGVIVIITSLILLIKTVQTATPIEFSSSEEVKEGQEGDTSTISVDVEGAVAKPGVYQLPVDSRVDDAIAASGGLAADADTERIAATINRAAKVVDGGKLYFPRQGETLSQPQQAQGRALNSQVSSLVSVNLASQSELEALAGIGPVTAAKIINGRPYQTLEELVSKKAMSQSLFNKLKEQLTL